MTSAETPGTTVRRPDGGVAVRITQRRRIHRRTGQRDTCLSSGGSHSRGGHVHRTRDINSSTPLSSAPGSICSTQYIDIEPQLSPESTLPPHPSAVFCRFSEVLGSVNGHKDSIQRFGIS